MSGRSSILLVLALVLLANQCSYAAYRGYDGWNNPCYNNQETSYKKPSCVAEGGDCEAPLSVCCPGTKCRREFWPLGSRCRNEFQSQERNVIWID